MRTQIILNPAADHGRAIDIKDQIISKVQEYGAADLVCTERPGHAKELALAAVDAGAELIVAAGGDGTVHEIVNGLVRGGQATANLGIIPIGSGNDYAYGMNLPTERETAIQNLFTGQPRTVDLARIEDDHGRYEIVCNGIGIGFDATIGIQALTITRVHGFAMYVLATLRTIALYFQAPHLHIRFDDLTVKQQALLLGIGIGPRIGGGFFLTPNASPDDGLLDSCTADPMSRLMMMRMLLSVMRGTHVNSKYVTMRRNRVIDIRADRPLPIHIDGEIFAYPENDVRRVTVSSMPCTLPIMAPVTD